MASGPLLHGKPDHPSGEPFAARLISSAGEEYPIDTQSTRIFHFADLEGIDFIEITHKTHKDRIFTDNEQLFETMEQLGFIAVNTLFISKDMEKQLGTAHVIADPNLEWDILDSDNRSITDKVKNNERLVGLREEKQFFPSIPYETARIKVYRGQGEKEIELNFFNTRVCIFERYPMMSHIYVEVSEEDRSVTPHYWFGIEDLQAALIEQGFTHTIAQFPTAEVVEKYLSWEEATFADKVKGILQKPSDESI
jgi:hypothetical protein